MRGLSRLSDEEVVWLKANTTLPYMDCHRAFVERFDRHDLTAKQLYRLRRVRKLIGYATTKHPAMKHPRDLSPHIDANGVPRVVVYDKETKRCRTVLQYRLVWEHENGPTPEGMNLSPKDGDYCNFDTNNWDLVDMAVTREVGHLTRQGLDGSKFRETIYAVAELRVKVRALKRKR